MVLEILQQQKEWKLVAPFRFESWARRGLPTVGLDQNETDSLVRCTPADGANGFFVALFQKKQNEVVDSNLVLSSGLDLDRDMQATRDVLNVRNRNAGKRKVADIAGLWQHMSKRLKF